MRIVGTSRICTLTQYVYREERGYHGLDAKTRDIECVDPASNCNIRSAKAQHTTHAGRRQIRTPDPRSERQRG